MLVEAIFTSQKTQDLSDVDPSFSRRRYPEISMFSLRLLLVSLFSPNHISG